MFGLSKYAYFFTGTTYFKRMYTVIVFINNKINIARLLLL